MGILPLWIAVVGGILLVRVRGFFLLHPWRCCRELCATLREGGACRRTSFCLSLAGTLGVGNISGVAFALLTGGAGSLCWLWVSLIFSCVLKYAELSASATLSDGAGDGMLGVLRHSFGPLGRYAAVLYAALCTVLAGSMGAMLQGRAITESVGRVSGLGVKPLALCLSLLLCAVLVLGLRGIERLCTVLVPLAAVIYVLVCCGVLVAGIGRLPMALVTVCSDALSWRSVLGGAGGAAVGGAIRRGFAVGMLSGEAGAGTATLAHALDRSVSPHGAGLIGISEVLVDGALCTLTGLALLVGAEGSFGTGDVRFVSDVFGRMLGPVAAWVLAACVFLFAFSTIICWYHYGCRCASYLGRGVGRGIFVPVYVWLVFLGGVCELRVAIGVSDAVLLGLCLLTLSALLYHKDCLSVPSGTRRKKGSVPRGAGTV